MPTINRSNHRIDPKIPFLETALNLQQAKHRLCTVIPNVQRITAANLVRHKLGRRALIEYHIETHSGPLTLLGKIRAKGTDYTSYHLQQALWNQGFDDNSPDGYSVPEPVGVIPGWRMWLQRKVPGIAVTELLPTNDGVAICHRIAGLAHKLHGIPMPTAKQQTLTDELNILHARLPRVAQKYPHWQTPIENILDACNQIVAHHPAADYTTPVVGIHRDFYGDQVLVDCELISQRWRYRIWLVDLDLYCQGHPALDIGNFIAHITEQSLRETGNPNAMADRETALRETFINTFSIPGLSAENLRYEIERYTLLTLVRHIHISTRIATRNHCTELLLALCETRLKSFMKCYSLTKNPMN
ncbi:aminoglycoside phosphotransferase [Leptolyngbya sp. Heron Island J]|uniref:phosphotransferase family protein n=1 Tax=Leptolyngbya sp. Heron Island J TaxID=1385935 RepID=UPI0003B97DE9|nr:phosphotransferase [Leptolyngbya sp. Heron Island J]ESA33374.1 aminoglycoside phosphotransferase [Leptolyngbya sp. Heron Island J]